MLTGGGNGCTGLFGCSGFFSFEPEPPSASGMGFLATAEAGLEIGRWHPDQVRFQVALKALIPFFQDDDRTYPVGLLLNVRFLAF